MMPICGYRCLMVLCLAGLSLPAVALEFSEAEIALIAQHGPWPPDVQPDSSNRVSANEAAISLGEMLFFDHKLGLDSRLSCASCHDPGQGFADGRITARGRVPLERNTTSLLNLKGNRWFGWGGENDSLWAQSIRPILASDEMASSPAQVKAVLLERPRYQEFYRRVFGGAVEDDDDDLVLVNTGKALAAYQETLVSSRSAFDGFREALLAGDQQAMKQYPESAQRGLRLFIGAGRCNLCHVGPGFSNGEFGDVGIRYFTANGVDPGRYRGIQQVRANRFNLLGDYNDGDSEENAISTAHLQLTQRNWGEFRIPGLRGVALTAPYMHNGSLASLRDVVSHYSKLDEERLHSDGEKILRPLNLDQTGIDDLVNFLRSLGEE